MNEIQDFISSCGFPIVMCLLLFKQQSEFVKLMTAEQESTRTVLTEQQEKTRAVLTELTNVITVMNERV